MYHLYFYFLNLFSDNEFYIFGGQHGYPDEDEDFIEGNNSEIYKLNLVTLKWTHLELIDKTLRPLPSEKGLMTIYKGNLFVFGGYRHSSISAVSISAILDLPWFIILSYFEFSSPLVKSVWK